MQKELKRRGAEDDVVARLKAEFRRLRLDLSCRVRCAKRSSWRDFDRDNSSDPWGIVYKILAGKIRPEAVLATLSTGATFISGGRQTGEELLRVLLPLDGEDDLLLHVDNRRHVMDLGHKTRWGRIRRPLRTRRSWRPFSL